MKYILDTSGFMNIMLIPSFKFVTVEEVLNEVKDSLNQSKVLSLDIEIMEPKKESIKEIKNKIIQWMPLEFFSNTDLKIMALAYETGYPVVTEDFDIQNALFFLGLKFESFSGKKIKYAYVYKKYCENCKKYYSNDKRYCENCGSQLKIKIVKKIKVKK